MPNQRTKKKITLGIYIGKRDMDIAAWFNMIRKQGVISAAKWIHAMLAADYMKEYIDIGAISEQSIQTAAQPIQPPVTPQRPPQTGLSGGRRLNFGSGNARMEVQKEEKPTKTRSRSGWDIKSPDGEYVYGSVVTISITTPETLRLIDRVTESGMEISSYVKVLIRANLGKNELRLPKTDEYYRIHDKYQLFCMTGETIKPITGSDRGYDQRPSQEVPSDPKIPAAEPSISKGGTIPHTDTKTPPEPPKTVTEAPKETKQRNPNPMLMHIASV